MKNKFVLLAAGAVLLAASVTTFVCTNKFNGSMDDLFKANVEALARNESGGIMCLQYMGEYDLTQPRVYCKTCTKIYSTVTTFAICYR